MNLKNKTDIFGDGKSYIAEIDMTTANQNEQYRIHFSQLATISRKKLESNHPDTLFNRLKKEANIDAPSRPVEFIPVQLQYSIYNNEFYLRNPNDDKFIETPISITDFVNKIGKFSYLDNNIVYTNLRCLMNAGLKYTSIPYNQDNSKFRCIVAKIPYFVYSHLVTHTQLSKEASSIRIQKKLTEDYWYPEVNDATLNIFKSLEKTVETEVDYLQNISKVRPEISYRELSQRRYIECVICGWEQNQYGWLNLFEERGAGEWKNWVQEPTKQTVKTIKQVLNM